MSDASWRILQVSTADWGGGAERVAWNLFEGLRARGHSGEMAVGFRRSGHPDVRLISPQHTGGPWTRGWHALGARALERFPGTRGTPAFVRATRRLAAPGSFLDAARGRECFRYPGTREILEGPSGPPDLVHLHNLHGGYFDLGALPWLSTTVPTALTLHDPWLFTGHCSYTLGCERWQTGCGACPHLDSHPALLRDGTAANWKRKQAMLRGARIHVCAPSRWLLEKVGRSLLAPAVAQSRVIPNGVDLTVFQPGDRASLRAEEGIEPDALVLTFVANRFRRRGSWKDWPTVREAVARASEALPETRIHLFAVGDAPEPDERIGRATVHCIDHTNDPAGVARYLQMADLALHAALPEAENGPLVVPEALACATPVVATAVGGVPEYLRGAWPGEDPTLAALNPEAPEQADGTLVPAQDPERMAEAITALATRPELRRVMADNGARAASQRYGLERQMEAYLEWYAEILHDHAAQQAGAR